MPAGKSNSLDDELVAHVRNAIHQQKHGETIGRRKTPVISCWPMRLKWEKFGEAWEALGTDGDADNECPTPDVLQLVYLRFGDKVLQLAYVLEPEVKEHRAMHYMMARNSLPKRLEVGR